jgi:vacuolar-type H+-ATPase subunit E/Vma4
MTGLEAVRTRHLADVHARAHVIVREAREQAQQIEAGSAAEAVALIEGAEIEGEKAAALDTSREWTAARRRGRGIILAAQHDVYEDLRAAAATALRADLRYQVLLQRLADTALRKLGPGADVVVDARGDRGVTATRKNRHVDWSLERIAKEGVDRLGPAVEDLWR